ncbi:histidine phosphatase family protein [Chitinibacter sp. GC72]|uniref:histidine phosphatase family protein n=1 Tax=Chitinibacter sp. GC72 TaxID=1526917 RepID=UPI0012F96894|nr:histidine phosphatase family protein [Chitinibacter sp. GC72]
MSRTIYLLRHGQTELNAERRMQGHCDSPLTELGQAQARAMGAALRRQLGDDARDWHMIASPLGRAMQTARLVCEELALPAEVIQAEPRLIEVAFGEWEAAPVEQLHAEIPVLATQPNWHFNAPNCEPYEAVLARIEHWLADPQLPHQLIVVAHGLLGKILRGVYAGLDFDALWAQDMPQEAFYKLHNRELLRIECTLPV